MKLLRAFGPMFLVAALAQAGDTMNSVALLYNFNEFGDFVFNCTATAINPTRGYKADKDMTLYLTAGHCVTSRKGGTTKPNSHIWLTSDAKGIKTFLPAELVFAGNAAAGEDIALLQSGLNLPPVEVAGDNEKWAERDTIEYTGAYKGLGKAAMKGQIAIADVDRPFEYGWAKADDLIALQMQAAPGVSGSAVMKGGKVIGVLVAADNGMAFAIPIAQLMKNPDEELDPKKEPATTKKPASSPKPPSSPLPPLVPQGLPGLDGL